MTSLRTEPRIATHAPTNDRRLRALNYFFTLQQPTRLGAESPERRNIVWRVDVSNADDDAGAAAPQTGATPETPAEPVEPATQADLAAMVSDLRDDLRALNQAVMDLRAMVQSGVRTAGPGRTDVPPGPPRTVRTAAPGRAEVPPARSTRPVEEPPTAAPHVRHDDAPRAARPADEIASAMSQLNTLMLGASPAFAQAMRVQTDAIASGLGALNAIGNQQSHHALELAATARGITETFSRPAACRTGGSQDGDASAK